MSLKPHLNKEKKNYFAVLPLANYFPFLAHIFSIVKIRGFEIISSLFLFLP